jgi:hypothetical protein
MIIEAERDCHTLDAGISVAYTNDGAGGREARVSTPIYWIGEVGAGRLAIVPRPRGDWLAEDLEGLQEAGIDVLVSLLTPPETVHLGLVDEPAVARALGLSFASLPIPDMGIPQDAAATRQALAGLHSALTAGNTVAIHCRQSIGRSSTIAASLLVMSGLSVREAWARVAHARGLPVPETSAQREWVERFAEWKEDGELVD